IAGFMAAAALLSMWISNTATSIMMMPIALSVAAAVLGPSKLDAPFTYALLLGIAYACSIGGLGTLVGTPTNLIVVGYLNENAGFDISFAEWMMVGLPAVLVMVPLAWVMLTRFAFKIEATENTSGQEVVREQLDGLGPLRIPEIRTLMVFGLIAFLWVFRKPLTEIEVAGVLPLAGMTDHLIAIFGVVLCFLVPAGASEDPKARLLDWPTAESIPWGVLLLFGGGMSLAAAITATGLGGWIGSELGGLAALPILVVMVVLTAFVIFATEVTSNIATASALMPVLGAVALTTGLPVEMLAVPLALSASCAFMLPMATGPNAVVFATGHVSLPTMARAGFFLNLAGILVISALSYVLAARVMG
ncbi:MAG: DASS family sodium-coupled anion symporter, partial [Pseudomonadota bacterium]